MIQTTQLKDLKISSDMMTSTQISSYIDQEINRKSNYTAFEVLPTDHDIAAGNSLEGYAFKVAVPANPVLRMQLTVRSLKADSNITIDFGDGSWISLKDAEIVSGKDGITRYDDETHDNWINDKCCVVHIQHTYSGVYLNKKNIVKVFGNNYYTIRGYSSSNASNQCIISRIFDYDLPIASCVRNVSSICMNSLRLTKIKTPDYYDFQNIENISGAFRGCKNLITVSIGANNSFYHRKWYSIGSMFIDCENLTDSDVRIPSTVLNGVPAVYSGCKNLSSTLENLLPTDGFYGKIDVTDMFFNCSNLKVNQISAVANALWNAPVEWTWRTYVNTRAFTNSSLSNMVPEMWGGTLDNSSIITIAKLNQEVKSLSERFDNIFDGNIIVNYDGSIDRTYVDDLTGNSYCYDSELSNVIEVRKLGSNYDSISSNCFCKTSNKKGAENLKSVNLRNITTINTESFRNCKLLSCVKANEVTAITGNNAFRLCTALSSLSLPKLKSISNNDTFLECTNLKEVVVDNEYYKFSNGAIIDVKKNELYYGLDYGMPENYVNSEVSSINSRAFYLNKSIKNISLPNLKTMIGNNVFNRSTMVSCHIPELTSIYADKDTFVQSKMTTLDFRGRTNTSIPLLRNSSVFNGLTDLSIIVPPDMYDEWIAAPQWNNVSSQIITVI